MGKLQNAWWVAALLLPGPLFAGPTIIGASFSIDKADCCTDYSIGVNVDVTGDAPIASVIVTHQPIAGGSAGQWALVQLGPTWWWNWSPLRPLFSSGPLDGVFEVTATDPVPGAEYYNLWVWDSVDRYYAHYQTVADPSELEPMPFNAFVPGRQYYLYFKALNVMPTGVLQSHFRSYNIRTFIHTPTAALLEKLYSDVVGVGPGTSLVDKVTMAQTSFAVPDEPATCAVLNAFQNEIRARTGKKVNAILAEQLLNDSSLIMAQMGCEDDAGRPVTALVGIKNMDAGARLPQPPGSLRRLVEH